MRLSRFAFVRRAFRRSRLRSSGLLTIVEFGEASLLDVALALGADLKNVRGAFLGDGEGYRYEDSLLQLGLVAWRVVNGVTLYRPTSAGRRVAALLRAERARRFRGRRASAI